MSVELQIESANAAPAEAHRDVDVTSSQAAE